MILPFLYTKSISCKKNLNFTLVRCFYTNDKKSHIFLPKPQPSDCYYYYRLTLSLQGFKSEPIY